MVSDAVNQPDYSYPVSRLKMMRGRQVIVISVPARLVMMYVRFPLSLRNVEELLHERGVDVSHETILF